MKPKVKTPTRISPDGEVLCENLFTDLVQRDPARLRALIESGQLADYDLTFAAEIFGRAQDAAPTLLALLMHPSAVVREGAVYGLGRHAQCVAVADALITQFCREPSPGVREAIIDVLDCYEDLR